MLAVTCFCAVMWALLIGQHQPRPGSSTFQPNYADLLPPGERERGAEWGLYLGPQRIGTSTMRVAREEDGTISLSTNVKANFGAAAKYIAGIAGTFEVDFRAMIGPLRGLLSWQLESRQLEASMVGVVRGDRMLIRGRLHGSPLETEMPYDPEGMISDAFSPMATFPSMSGMAVGQSWTAAILNPLTGSVQDVTVRIARMQEIDFGGEQVRAFQLDSQGPGGRWTCWVTEDSQVLVQGTPFGLTLRREDLPAESLRALTDAPPPSEATP